MTNLQKTLFMGFCCLIFLTMPNSGAAKISGQASSCSIYDPMQDKIVQAQWTGSCSNGKAEGTGTAKWLGPSQTFRGRQFPFQYDGDVRNGRFHGRGRLVRENIAMTGKFSNGNLNKNGKMIGQMLPTWEIINGSLTLEEAFTATASQVMEFNCNNGECSNSAYLNKIQQEELATYLFGAAVSAYLVKEGAAYFVDALRASASSADFQPDSSGNAKIDQFSFTDRCQKEFCPSGSSGKNCRGNCVSASGFYAADNNEDGLTFFCAALCNVEGFLPTDTENSCLDECQQGGSSSFHNILRQHGIL